MTPYPIIIDQNQTVNEIKSRKNSHLPPHLAFSTPGQNQKAKQGTKPETLKRNKPKEKWFKNTMDNLYNGRSTQGK